MRNTTLLFAFALFNASAQAQMSVPLMDEKDNIPTSAQWKVAAPILEAGLECQKPIDANDPAIKPLSTVKKNEVNFVIVPPQGFKVFGLPYRE